MSSNLPSAPSYFRSYFGKVWWGVVVLVAGGWWWGRIRNQEKELDKELDKADMTRV